MNIGFDLENCAEKVYEPNLFYRDEKGKESNIQIVFRLGERTCTLTRETNREEYENWRTE
jgi:hypothetical protein